MEITKYMEPHWRVEADGMVLVGARNPATGAVRFPPPEFLQVGESAEPESIGGEGRLYTFTTVHPGKAPAYSLAMVDFRHDLRIFGRLTWRGDAPPAIGAALRVIPFTLPDGAADYAFEPAPQGVSS